MDNDLAKIYLIFWCPPDTTPEFETSYLEDYGKVFATEVRIRGLDYVGRGVSSTKEGSKNNASIHYLMHLIRDGLLEKERVAKRVPCLPLGVHADGSFDPSPLPDFLEPVTDESFRESNYRSERDPYYDDSPRGHSYRSGQVDIDSEMSSYGAHGNWTLENALEGLENYFGPNIKDKFSYHTTGSGDNRVISCDISVYMDELGREVRGWGQGKTIATASSHCALSFIRQLYEKDLIGPYRRFSYQDRGEVPLGMTAHRSFESRHELTFDDWTNPNSRFSAPEHVPLQVLVPQQAINDVIGTGGSILKRIETKTGAKITFAEESKDGDLEGRIFTLYGEQDKVQAAAYIINKIIQWSLVKAANSLKQVLPIGDQSLASEKGIVKNEPNTSLQKFGMAGSSNQKSSASELQDFMTDISSKPIQSKKIIVPQDAVKFVIGKDGNVIRSIEKSSGTFVQFVNNMHHKKNAPSKDRLCSVTGTAEQINVAVNDIHTIIHHVQEHGCLPPQFQVHRPPSSTDSSGVKTVKISVAPDIVGYVIGKEGSTIKRIKKTTGVKITLNVIKGAAFKVFEISGASQGVEAAARKIQSIINVAESKDENKEPKPVIIEAPPVLLKKEEMTGHATSAQETPSFMDENGCLSSEFEFQESTNSTVTPGFTTVQMKVAPEIVGYVIGKEGSTIKRIKKATGAKINLTKMMDGEFKIFEINGVPQRVKAAIKEIQSIIDIAEQKEEKKGPTPVVIEAPPVLLKKEEMTESATSVQETPSFLDTNEEPPSQSQQSGDEPLKILIPEKILQFVTGKGEATIAHISAKSGAKIVIDNKRLSNKTGFRSCLVSGSPEAVDTAAKRINALINIGMLNFKKSAPAAEATPEPPKGSAKLEVLVPVEMVECVMGKDGATINRISKDTGCHIVLHEDEPGVGFGVRRCVITGEPPDIVTAARRINALINVGVVRQTTIPLFDSVQAQQQQQQQQYSQQQLAMPFGYPMQMQTAPQNMDRRSIIDALEQQLSKKNISSFQQNQAIMPAIRRDSSLQPVKMNLPKPQRNWYRMAISNLNSTHAVHPGKQYEFVLQRGLEKLINGILAIMKVNPAPVPRLPNHNTAISLVLKQNISTGKTNVSSQPDLVMRWWSPPLKNWDPWLNKTIDELPLSEMSLEQISFQLMNAHFTQIQDNKALRNCIKERKAACVRSYQHEILHTVKTNSVSIIYGPSGSGKTTQVPQYILDSYLNLERGAECCILVAEPRRLNAVAAAERIAKERCEVVGNSIGYEVPFESCFPRPYGCILFCTLDILLKRLEAGIRGVSHIIMDEIHERNAQSDFVLAILRDMVKAFPHLHVVLLSATMDITPLKQYFSNCGIFEVPLKTHTVQDYYLEDIIQMLGFVPDPRKKNKETEYSDHLDDKEDVKSYEAANYVYENMAYSSVTKLALANIDVKGLPFDLIVALLKYISSLPVKGTILIFVPDCSTISTLMYYLQTHSALDISAYLLLPLHPEISPEQMKLVFQPAPPGITKIILSTSIAETAVTPRDVVYVIDSCKTVIKRFTSFNNAINYTTVWATKYNLEQRNRQASFVQPGCCFRLCSRECYAKLKNDITPEIQYNSLHEIILSIKLLRLGNNKQFLSKLLKSPTSKAILDAEEFLADLGAIDTTGNLTPLGKMLARLPVEPQLGKMIILSCLFSLGDAACLLAAHHSILPQSSAPNLEKFVGYRCSDHIAFVNAFTQWQKIRRDEMKQKEFCERHHLSKYSLKLIYDGKEHLKELVQSMGFSKKHLAERYLILTSQDLNVDLLIALLVMGLHPNICFHNESKKATESSVNLVTSMNSPFFVFGRKICTDDATYKDMTMISVAHLLLFGKSNIHLIHGKINIDSWIDLKMDPKVVSKITAVRSALEMVISEVAVNPKSLDSLDAASSKLLSIVKVLCNEAFDEDSLISDQYDNRSIHSSSNEPPSKRRMLDAGSWKSGKEDQSGDDYFNTNTGYSLNSTTYGNSVDNIGSNPSASSNYSADRYESDNRYYERRVPAGERDELGGPRYGVDRRDSDQFQPNPASSGGGRASMFLVDRKNSEYYQRYASERNIDDFRESRFGYSSTEDSRRPGSNARSGLGYWSRNLDRV